VPQILWLGLEMSKNHENSALTVCHCDNVLIDVEFTTSSLLTNTFILGTDADFCSGIDPRTFSAIRNAAVTALLR